MVDRSRATNRTQLIDLGLDIASIILRTRLKNCGPAILQSRAQDDTGYVQPKINQLRAVRGTRSIYHQNAIQSWRVAENGEVSNVQIY